MVESLREHRGVHRVRNGRDEVNTFEETGNGVERWRGGSRASDVSTRVEELRNDEFRREDVCSVGEGLRDPCGSR